MSYTHPSQLPCKVFYNISTPPPPTNPTSPTPLQSCPVDPRLTQTSLGRKDATKRRLKQTMVPSPALVSENDSDTTDFQAKIARLDNPDQVERRKEEE